MGVIFDKKSTKGKIVGILSDEFPLSLKEIFNRLSKSVSISNQAVFKNLNELVDERVLVKEDTKYKVSREWIDKISSYASFLKSKQENVRGVGIYTFDSIYETDLFLINFINSKTSSKTQLGMKWIHFWIPLFVGKSEYTILKEIVSKVEFFALSEGNTSIDKWCAVFWNKYGNHAKTGVSVGSLNLAVFNEFIIQVHYPENIKRRLSNFFSKAKSFESFDLDSFFSEVMSKKAEITLIIQENELLAQKLLEEIKFSFK